MADLFLTNRRHDLGRCAICVIGYNYSEYCGSGSVFDREVSNFFLEDDSSRTGEMEFLSSVRALCDLNLEID